MKPTMENQIKRLVEIGLKWKDAFNDYDGRCGNHYHIKEIDIYVSESRDHYSIEIKHLYTNGVKIGYHSIPLVEFPHNMTAENLSELADYAESELAEYIKEKEKNHEAEKQARKEARIKELQQELEILTNQNTKDGNSK